jgi:putative SOS response-associated peptidase YedK
MCARYGISFSATKVNLLIGGKTVSIEFSMAVRFEKFPTDRAQVAREINGEIEAAEMRWGFLPKWMKAGRPVINARGDKLLSSSFWKDAFESRRCLIPATSFYEWQAVPGQKKKLKFEIRPLDQALFFFAGLWDSFHDKDGQPVDCFTIITTEPNDVMRPIHNRMPVILGEGDRGRWIEGRELDELIKPYQGPMHATPSE